MAEENLEKWSNKKKPPEGTTPSEMSDIQKWPEVIKKAKIEAKRERLAFMDQIEGENSLKKLFDTSSKDTKESPKASWKYSSFDSTEGNRISGDEQKGAFEGALQSLWAPFPVAGDMISDAWKLARSPRKETLDAYAYLKERDPNIEIV